MRSYVVAAGPVRPASRSKEAPRCEASLPRMCPTKPAADDEVQRLRAELADVRQQLNDLRAAASTFVRGLV